MIKDLIVFYLTAKRTQVGRKNAITSVTFSALTPYPPIGTFPLKGKGLKNKLLHPAICSLLSGIADFRRKKHESMLSQGSGLLLFHQGKSKSHSAAVSRGKTEPAAKNSDRFKVPACAGMTTALVIL